MEFLEQITTPQASLLGFGSIAIWMICTFRKEIINKLKMILS